MDTPNVSPSVAHGRLTKVILIVVALAVLLGAAWWLTLRVTPTAPVAAPGTANQPTQDLGSALYNSASNPVSGKLPETVAPVPNPIKGLYTNPF